MFNLRLAPALLVTLAACGGGGGGGGGSAVEVPFASFSSISGNQTVVMTGISETIAGTVSPFNGMVTGIDANSVLDTSGSAARLTYQGFGGLNNIALTTPRFGVSAGNVDCSTQPICTAENATAAVIIGNPTSFGWNYQTFGVWLNEVASNGFQVGAISAGAVTPASAVTTLSTNAIFNGFTSGFYVDSGGTPYFTSATVRADVNFGAGSIDFRTSSTTIGSLIGPGAPISNSDLNINGILTYTAATNQFSGTVNSAPAAGLTGRANGRFYGPAAQEMGGVYSLTGTGFSRMIGAFGARQ